jgi:hypothetical protein
MLFSLIQHHKYSIAEVEDLIPFERDIFVQMLLQFLQELKEQREKNGK